MKLFQLKKRMNYVWENALTNSKKKRQKNGKRKDRAGKGNISQNNFRPMGNEPIRARMLFIRAFHFSLPGSK